MISTKNIYRAYSTTAILSFVTMVSSPFMHKINLETVVEQSSPVSKEDSLPVSYNWLALFGASAVLSVSATLATAYYGNKYEEELKKSYEYFKIFANNFDASAPAKHTARRYPLRLAK